MDILWANILLLLAYSRGCSMSVLMQKIPHTLHPSHRYSLHIGWRRGSHPCHVPAELGNHGKRAKPQKADRGISKAPSNIIFRNTGIFLPVGSHMYVKIYLVFWFGYFLCIIETETEHFLIVNTFQMTTSTSTLQSWHKEDLEKRKKNNLEIYYEALSVLSIFTCQYLFACFVIWIVLQFL